MANENDNTNLLVVLGATGTQGGAVLRYFAQYQDSSIPFRLRGVTRNTDSAASKSLSELGIEMVAADLDDIDSLRHAFVRATHIFANTDSNTMMFDAMQHPEKMSPGQSPTEFATIIEKRYGMNIIEAAASTGTLKRIIWSGLASPKKWSNGRYTKVAMFDVKEEITEMFRARDELHGKLSVVMVGFYANDALKLPDVFAPRKTQDGRYELLMHMSSDCSVPMANVEADLGSWVLTLIHAEPGVILIGASECLTWPQWLQHWEQHNRVEAIYREVSADKFAPGLGELHDAFVEEFRFVEELGFAGGMDDAVYPEQVTLGGAGSLNTHLTSHSFAQRASQFRAPRSVMIFRSKIGLLFCRPKRCGQFWARLARGAGKYREGSGHSVSPATSIIKV